MAERTLTVKILGDSRSLQRELDRSSRSAQGFHAQITGLRDTALKAGAAVGLALGGREVVRQAFAMVDASSNLNEQVNKSAVVFGQSADSVLRWSRTTADAFGVSQRAALEAASGFGQILETSGLNEKRAAQMSRSLVELAADIASFNNIDPAEALDKLRSGLAGEAEPLRRVGVLLSEARVKNEAYTSGIAKQNAKLTEGQKVQARYNLILKDTATAQGDFARTSGSLANKQRILSARVEELQARLGQDLVPILSSVIDKLLAGEDAARRFANALNSLPGGTSFKLKDLFGSGIKKSDIDDLKRQSNLLDAVARGGGLDQRLERAAKAAADAEKAGRIPAALRNTIFDQAIARKLDRVQDVSTLRGQISALENVADLIQQRIAVTKDITRKLNLEDAIVDIRRRQRSLRAQIAQNQQEARLLAAQKERERIEAAKEASARRVAAIQARQFRTLGLTAQGDEPVPGVRALRHRLGTLTDQLSGTFLDTRKTESVLNRIRKVLSGGLGAVGRDVRAKIHEIFADLDRQLKDHEQKGPATKTTALNADRILAGLGLSRDEIRALRSRLSGFNSAGVALAGKGATGVFGVPVVEVNLDGRKVSTTVRRQNTIHGRSNPKQRRGRRR